MFACLACLCHNRDIERKIRVKSGFAFKPYYSTTTNVLQLLNSFVNFKFPFIFSRFQISFSKLSLNILGKELSLYNLKNI